MGCCFSSTTATGYPNQQQQSDFQSPPKSESKSPQPPPPLEEEAVKEIVISEIPISKSPCSTVAATAIVEEEKLKKTEFLINKQEKTETPPNEISQVSGGYTEISFSTTTTTTIRENHDEAESKLSIEESKLNRGPIYKLPRKRLYNGRRRVPQSPAKIAGEHGGRRLASSSSKNVGVRPTQRNVGLTRPRTPAVALGAGGPVKEAEESGGRQLLGNVESGEKICAEEVNETLENPHVSLECFIFL